MKIAFVGTHGVGKTTLCYELAALLKKHGLDVELVKEVARSCPLPINRETSLLAQLWILHSQIAREIEMEARHGVVICDRSVLDNYAYMLHASGPQPAAERIVDDWISSYTLLFRVPRVGRPPADGIRDVDLEFQVAIDDTLDRLLAAKNPPFFDLTGLARSRWIGAAVQAALAVRRGEQAPVPAAPGPAVNASQLRLFDTE